MTFLIKPREIHGDGLGFLHGAYVYHGVKCAVLLRTADGKPAQLAATITGCRHVTGRIHETSAEFDRAIQVGDYRFSDGSALSKSPG